jgi:agmatinase
MKYLSHSLFADANASFEEAEYVLFGVPYDGTTSYLPGTRRGPAAIRAVSQTFEQYIADEGIDMADIPVTDIGDVEPYALPGDVVDQVQMVVCDIVSAGKVPIMLGGEHSVTLGAVKALRPDCYIVCDAHLDLRPEYGGTPLSHACTTRRVADEGVDEIFIIGGRSGTEEEFEFARQLHLYTADHIRERGITAVVEEILHSIGEKTVYLSIDADAIDCCLTPGLGTPEPFGLNPLDIREVIRAFAGKSIGFDYVEVCPIDAGQTAAVAARLIRTFIAVHWRQTK